MLQSSRQGELHPKPLTEPYLKVSLHTALLDRFLLLCLYFKNHPFIKLFYILRLSSEALRSVSITETSSLLRLHPPPTFASLLLTSQGLCLHRFDFPSKVGFPSSVSKPKYKSCCLYAEYQQRQCSGYHVACP